MPTNLRKHIFQGSQGSDFCVKNTVSRLDSPCGKRRSDDIHIEKKIIKNIHPPKDPRKRAKPGPIRIEKALKKFKRKMARASRKKNRV